MENCASVEAFRTAPDDIDADFIFVCQDESMTGARLLPGNVVFIKACSDAEDGKIVLVKTSNGFMLRRIYRSENGIALQPCNHRFHSDLIIPGMDIEIVGVAVKAMIDIS